MSADAAVPNAVTAPPGVAVPCIDGLLDLPSPLPLHHGGALSGARLAWRLSGPADAPAIAVLGGISAGRHVYPACAGETAGWWDEVVGPGLALDTNAFRVVAMDFLGGSGETTGPSPGETFPSISAFDQASVLVALLDHLGIGRLRACIGASYGGMVALSLAQSRADRVEGVIAISAAHRTHPMSTAWRSVQRNIVRYALEHGEGARGLVLARALAMATYRSAREFDERFSAAAEFADGRFRFPVESYLLARGASYAAHYRPEAFVCLSESIDLHRIDPSSIHVPVTLVAVIEDQLVPLSDVRELRDTLAGTCQLVEINSLFGHDAFLKEKEVLRDVFAQALA